MLYSVHAFTKLVNLQIQNVILFQTIGIIMLSPLSYYIEPLWCL